MGQKKGFEFSTIRRVPPGRLELPAQGLGRQFPRGPPPIIPNQPHKINSLRYSCLGDNWDKLEAAHGQNTDNPWNSQRGL
jgi:hypothetical protein